MSKITELFNQFVLNYIIAEPSMEEAFVFTYLFAILFGTAFGFLTYYFFGGDKDV